MSQIDGMQDPAIIAVIILAAIAGYIIGRFWK